jgi:hypothetical protein
VRVCLPTWAPPDESANGWLNAIYKDAFDRAVDPGAQSSFSQALSSGAKSFLQAADIIFTIPEYYQELGGSYITTLDSAPGGLSYYPPRSARAGFLGESAATRPAS